MPITNTPLTRDQFEFLQQNITDQVTAVSSAGAIAQSGLHFVVLLQVDAPEVDLVNPFFDQLQRMDGLDNTSNWVPVVNALNQHVIIRGTAAVGTQSDRLNAYLTAHAILVTAEYANLSNLAGYVIDPCNIEPGTTPNCPAMIDSELTATGTHSTFFSYTITAKGTLPITFGANSTDLAAVGLVFNGIDTISGTLTATPGSYNVRISAFNSVNASTPDNEVLAITVL